MSVFVNDGGIEKEAKMIYVNDGGIDKLVAGASEPLRFLEYGDEFEGGFFAGLYTVGTTVYALIVAPKSSETTAQWKTANTSTAGTTSDINGLSNSNSMNNADHPAAFYCRNYNGGGFNDWFLPASQQIEIAFFNLKPITQTNITNTGANTYAVPPRTSNYTSGRPGRTSAELFQEGGEQAFETVTTGYWSSTQITTANAMFKRFDQGSGSDTIKTLNKHVRPFRSVVVLSN